MAIGIIDYAQPAAGDVMPWHLAKTFKRSDQHTVWRNEYANGEVQVLAATYMARRTWEMDLSLIAAHLDELCDYFEGHAGGMVPFYFYDVAETANYAYDTSGVSVIGRYCVRFDCPYALEMGLGSLRGAIPIRLIELAALDGASGLARYDEAYYDEDTYEP